MTMKRRTYLLPFAIAISLAAVPAFAQDPPADQNKITGSINVGAQDGNGIDASSKLQQYETVPKGVTVFDANVNWVNGKNFMNFEGRKLGQADQYSAFQAGRTGAWKLSLSLNENPRWFSNQAETLYNQASPGVFRLPDAMRLNLQQIWSPATGQPAAPANSSDNRFWSLRDYMNGAQPVDLSYERKVGNVGLAVTAIQDWTFKGSYQRETRNGSEPLAFTAGPGIDEVANPVQFTTQDSRGEVEYAKNKLFINGSFGYNQFDNAVLFTTVDNPVLASNTSYSWTSSPTTITNANATARLWNAPSNKATSFDVTGGYLFPSHHKLTLTASEMMMKNDYSFIAQATNPNLNLATTDANYGKFTLTPEYSAFNGQLNQTLLMANFTGDPTPKFGYSAFYRSFDLTDKTPSYTFRSTVNSDGGASYSATGTTSSEDARAYNSGQFKVEAHVLPAPGLKIGVNAGQLKTTYQDRSYNDVKDNTVGVSLDLNHKWAMFHGSFTNLARTPGSPNPQEAAEGTTGGPLDINAAWRDIAKQDAKLYNATLTLTPVDQISLAIFGSGMNSNFPDTSIGLKTNNVRSAGVDLTYAPLDKFSVNAGYIYESYQMDSNLWYAANGTVAAPVATNTSDKYFNTINDKVNTYRAGFRLTLVPAKAELGSDYDYSKGRSDSSFTVNPGGVAGGDMLFPTAAAVNFPVMQYLNYPEVFNATTIWKTWLNYHVDKRVMFTLMYWNQKFEQADWAYDGLAPYMLTGSSLYATTPGAVANIYPQLDPSANRALFLGAGVPNYNASIIRASMTVRF
jgi:hypothetical protein